MDNREMKFNASGYYDPTPYKALTTDPKPGEIWINKAEVPLLVIENTAGICTTVRLNDTPRDEHSVEIKGGDMARYVNPQYTSYCRAFDLMQYVRQVADEELGEVKAAYAEILDIAVAEEEDPHDDYPDETEYVLNIEQLEADNAALAAEVEELRKELFKASVEARTAEVYRDMYEKLLAMMVRERVGGC